MSLYCNYKDLLEKFDENNFKKHTHFINQLKKNIKKIELMMLKKFDTQAIFLEFSKCYYKGYTLHNLISLVFKAYSRAKLKDFTGMKDFFKINRMINFKTINYQHSDTLENFFKKFNSKIISFTGFLVQLVWSLSL